MKTKRDNFVNAAHRLAEAVTDYQNIRNDTVRDGMIQRFEFTFELGWKALKEHMLDAGMQNTLQFPKQVLREAYAAELIDDDRQAAAVMSGVQERYYKALRALASLYGL